MRIVPGVTVVMRSKNSDWVIGQTLAALFSQSFVDFELLLVDSGSTDRTLEIAAGYPHRLLAIPPEDYFPGAVLNRAVDAARSPLIVFLNSDAVLTTSFALERLVAAFRDPDVQGAFGRQTPRPDAATWVRRDYAVSFPAQGPAPDWMPLSLVFSALRRACWEYQPFYGDAWGSEDIAWGLGARARGWKVAYVPDAIAMHSHNYTLRQLYGRRFIEGEADAFLYGERIGWSGLLVPALSAIAQDILPHLRARDLPGLLASPVRRVVARWGYFQGHCHGRTRQATGDRDLTLAQRVVLERHESVDREEAA